MPPKNPELGRRERKARRQEDYKAKRVRRQGTKTRATNANRKGASKL